MLTNQHILLFHIQISFFRTTGRQLYLFVFVTERDRRDAFTPKLHLGKRLLFYYYSIIISSYYHSNINHYPGNLSHTVSYEQSQKNVQHTAGRPFPCRDDYILR